MGVFPVYTSACRQSWSGERYPGQGSEWAPPSSGARGTADLVLFFKTSNLLSTDPLAPCFRARVCCSPCLQLVPPQQTLQPDLRRRLHTYATDKVGRGYVLRVASVEQGGHARVHARTPVCRLMARSTCAFVSPQVWRRPRGWGHGGRWALPRPALLD